MYRREEKSRIKKFKIAYFIRNTLFRGLPQSRLIKNRYLCQPSKEKRCRLWIIEIRIAIFVPLFKISYCVCMSAFEPDKGAYEDSFFYLYDMFSGWLSWQLAGVIRASSKNKAKNFPIDLQLKKEIEYCIIFFACKKSFPSLGENWN